LNPVIRKKRKKSTRSWSKAHELVLAIRPLYVPDLDGCDKRPTPAIAYKEDFSYEGKIPFFYGRTKGELARKIYNSLKS